MKYDEMIKVVANTDKTTLDRSDMVIKDIGKVLGDIVEYRYAAEHYKGDSKDVLYDKAMSIKNSVALLETDLDIFEESLGIRNQVEEKKEGRLIKIVNKIS